MAAPSGQSCETCKFWQGNGDIQAIPEHSTCNFDKPSTGDSTWPMTKRDQWCGMWEDVVPPVEPPPEPPGIEPTYAGAGLRGNTEEGEKYPDPSDWTQLTPGFVQTTTLFNFALVNPGVLELQYLNPEFPNMSVLIDFQAICSVSSDQNNNGMLITIGQNGSVLDEFRVPAEGVQSGDVMPIPIIGSLIGRNGDQFSLYTKHTRGTSEVTLWSYHFVLRSTIVLSTEGTNPVMGRA